jgi:exodeoxyribonuclease-3
MLMVSEHQRKKGLMPWLINQNPDFICIQELKAQRKDLNEKHLILKIGDIKYKNSIFCAKKKGYSGVGIYSKISPTSVKEGINIVEFDTEGRVLRLDFDNKYSQLPLFSIVSLYLPSGSASDKRQESKFRFLKSFAKILSSWIEENQLTGREFLLCGDWNIAHTELDLKNWKQNKKKSGFLPEERKWLSEIVFYKWWFDIFRIIKPNIEQYTWWSQRGGARKRNVGWRIDYQIGTERIAQMAKKAWVESTPLLSDHAPVIIEYDVN